MHFLDNVKICQMHIDLNASFEHSMHPEPPNILCNLCVGDPLDQN